MSFALIFAIVGTILWYFVKDNENYPGDDAYVAGCFVIILIPVILFIFFAITESFTVVSVIAFLFFYYFYQEKISKFFLKIAKLKDIALFKTDRNINTFLDKEIIQADIKKSESNSANKKNFIQFNTEFPSRLCLIIIGGRRNKVRKDNKYYYINYNKKFEILSNKQKNELVHYVNSLNADNFTKVLARLEIQFKIIDNKYPQHIVLKNKSQAIMAEKRLGGKYARIPKSESKEAFYIFGNTPIFNKKNKLEINQIIKILFSKG